MKSSEIIKAIREAKGMSQNDLAIKAGYKTRSSITKIEKGTSDPSQKALRRIAHALNVSPAVLLGTDEETSPSSERGMIIDMIQSASEPKVHLLYLIVRTFLEAEDK